MRAARPVEVLLLIEVFTARFANFCTFIKLTPTCLELLDSIHHLLMLRNQNFILAVSFVESLCHLLKLLQYFIIVLLHLNNALFESFHRNFFFAFNSVLNINHLFGLFPELVPLCHRKVELFLHC
jgi:hypothetical protein